MIIKTNRRDASKRFVGATKTGLARWGLTTSIADIRLRTLNIMKPTKTTKTQATVVDGDLVDELTGIIMVLQRSFLLKLSKSLGEGSISFPQFFLLSYLVQGEQMTMTDIARRMGHTTAAATGLVDRLESLGYVKREHSSEDRRKILVRTTAKAGRLVAGIRGEMSTSMTTVLEMLEPSERTGWLHIYRKIHSFCESCAQP